MAVVFGGKYTLEETSRADCPSREFLAHGRRGAVYGCVVDSDGCFRWLNMHIALRSVPFDLAQVSPLAMLPPAPTGA